MSHEIQHAPFQVIGSADIDRHFKLLEEGIFLPPSVLRRLLAGQIDLSMLSMEVILTLNLNNTSFIDQFVAPITGTGQVFLLSSTPVNNSDRIFINGLLMQPGADYTILGTTLTITRLLILGDKISTFFSAAQSATASISGSFALTPFHQIFQSMAINNNLFIRGKDSLDLDKFKIAQFNPLSFVQIGSSIDVDSGIPDNSALVMSGLSLWTIGSPSSAINNRVIEIDPATMSVVTDLEVVPSTDTAAVISALASDGSVFVYAYIKGGVVASQKIAKINTTGIPVITGTIVSQVSPVAVLGPVDMAISQSGHLFVLWHDINGGAGSVRKYDVGTGNLETTYTNFTNPLKIIRVNDKMFVIDDGTNSLWSIPQTGNPVQILTFGSAPTDILFDGSDVWIAFGQNLTKMLINGTTLSQFNPVVSGQTIQDIMFGIGHIWTTYSDDGATDNITKIFPGLPGI